MAGAYCLLLSQMGAPAKIALREAREAEGWFQSPPVLDASGAGGGRVVRAIYEGLRLTITSLLSVKVP